jgi:hypothetical protein
MEQQKCGLKITGLDFSYIEVRGRFPPISRQITLKKPVAFKSFSSGYLSRTGFGKDLG